MSEEAIKARAKAAEGALAAEMKGVKFEGEDGEGEGNVYDELAKWIEEQGEELGGVSKVKDVDIYLKAKELGIETKHRTLQVLAQTLFTDSIIKELPTRAQMLSKMTSQGEKHEKAFLGGIEHFVGIDKPALIPKVSAILLQIRTEDIICDETLKAWGGKASKKYVDIGTSKKVRKSAQTFLDALENMEDSEEEEESD